MAPVTSGGGRGPRRAVGRRAALGPYQVPRCDAHTGILGDDRLRAGRGERHLRDDPVRETPVSPRDPRWRSSTRVRRVADLAGRSSGGCCGTSTTSTSRSGPRCSPGCGPCSRPAARSFAPRYVRALGHRRPLLPALLGHRRLYSRCPGSTPSTANWRPQHNIHTIAAQSRNLGSVHPHVQLAPRGITIMQWHEWTDSSRSKRWPGFRSVAYLPRPHRRRCRDQWYHIAMDGLAAGSTSWRPQTDDRSRGAGRLPRSVAAGLA